eukprot:TRINITY_DN78320_c0_g1_i1.p1 TRINITY_DN78320_c0_g1~~TRINITY_DN78320_c0_g1_i1.p1  ORF type:complete len:162 (+),score=26.04 TRINITY_DN78320_c0_g1_i1:105-590(+)
MAVLGWKYASLVLILSLAHAQDIFLADEKKSAITVTAPVPPKMLPGIDAHVLDTSVGAGAGGVKVELHYLSGADYVFVAALMSEDSGRTDDFWQRAKGNVPLVPGTYRLTFHVGDYYSKKNVETFYPEVVVNFRVKENEVKQNFHVPITLSPFGYSTYRGV